MIRRNQKFRHEDRIMRIFDIVITLYDPKSTTWHVRTASRPTAAVTLAMGAENFGSVDRLTGKNVRLKLVGNVVEMNVAKLVYGEQIFF